MVYSFPLICTFISTIIHSLAYSVLLMYVPAMPESNIAQFAFFRIDNAKSFYDFKQNPLSICNQIEKFAITAQNPLTSSARYANIIRLRRNTQEAQGAPLLRE